MTPADATALGEILTFLQSIGVGFGDVVVIIVLCGFFWLINKGKIKIGANGMGEDIKAIRTKVQELDVKVGRLDERLETMEQYRNK